MLYSVQLKNMYSYRNNSLKLSRGLSCQQPHCNLLSLYKLIIIIHFILSYIFFFLFPFTLYGAQWLSGRALDSRPKGRGFEPHRRHCVVSLSKNINPSSVLVQPRKIRPFITERMLMGRKELNQTNKHSHYV